MKDAPTVKWQLSSFFLVVPLSFLQRMSWQVVPAEKRRPATSQHSTRRLKTEIRIWVPAVFLCRKQVFKQFNSASHSLHILQIVNRLDAEAEVEAIEKMDQKDQHHRSAKHCMDSSLLWWFTHRHTQSCLCRGDMSMCYVAVAAVLWDVVIWTEISRSLEIWKGKGTQFGIFI